MMGGRRAGCQSRPDSVIAGGRIYCPYCAADHVWSCNEARLEKLQPAKKPLVRQASYLAIPPARVAELMRDAGFVDVERIDGRFFQPVLAGTRPRGFERAAVR